jgi:dTDP-4-dehydrorhamnose 3,5-epimerase
VLVLEPQIFSDERGRFLETHRIRDVMEEAGHPIEFVQSNLSYSLPGVLRGLHFQTKNPQGKLMRCISGRIQQVCVDLREGSPYFAKHVATLLDDITCKAVWCPPGFANGFLVPANGPGAAVYYECSSVYVDEWSGAVKWDDSDIGIKWMTMGRNPILSNKDRRAPSLRSVEPIRLGGSDV